MSTPLERIDKIKHRVLFTTAILAPIETARIVGIATFIVPLLLFSGIEYIVSGEDKYTEKLANTIENGGKHYVEEMAIKMNITDKIY